MKFYILAALAYAASAMKIEYDTSYDEQKMDAFNRWM